MDDLARVSFADAEAIEPPSNATQPVVGDDAQDLCAPRPFHDLPEWVWRAFFASWALLLSTLALFFGVSLNVWFVLGVIAVFAAVFFCTPLVLLRMTRRGDRPACGRHVDLLYGRCTNIEAAIQIILLPVALSVGLVAIVAMIPQ